MEMITQNTDEFGVSMTFTTPDGVSPEVTVEVVGTSSIHNISFDTMGNMINGQNAHVSIAEKAFTDAGYTVRDANGKVALKNHKVTVADNTGTDRDFIVREQFPDERLGLVVCILGTYSNG